VCVPALVEGLVIGSLISRRRGSSTGGAPPTDADSERATAEAKATQAANAKLAADNRRRRGQQSLIAQGASGIDDAEASMPTIGPISRKPQTPLVRWGR
jgi:hypothetical protein